MKIYANIYCMKISIITVCKNSEKEIEKTLSSIYSQTYKNIEHIVVDGASTDNTLNILNDYKQNISILISDPDTGVYNAMNKGIKAATGDVLYFLNAGDSLYSSNVLEKIVECFEQTKADIVFGDVYFTNSNNFLQEDLTYKPNQAYSYKNLMIEQEFPGLCHQVIFYKKEVFDKLVGYNENYRIFSDYEFNIRAFVVNKFSLFYIDKIIANFDLGGLSTKYKSFDTNKNEIEIIREETGYNKLLNGFTFQFKKRMYKLFRTSYKMITNHTGWNMPNFLNFRDQKTYTPNLKVTILTVCKNAEKTIEKTIHSVLNQTYKNIEYIVLDGDSDDNTLQIVEKYKGLITKLVSEPDSGIYNAYNKAVNLASGDIIYFLNADDVFADNDVIEKVAYAFNKSKADAVIGNAKFIENNGSSYVVKTKYTDALQLAYATINHQAMFIKSDLFKKYGLFDESYKICADYDFNIRLFVENKLKTKYINKTIVKYSACGASSSGNTFDENIIIQQRHFSPKTVKLAKILNSYYKFFLKRKITRIPFLLFFNSFRRV